MDDRKVEGRDRRYSDVGNSLGGRRESREKRERKMTDSFAKFGAVRSVPGIYGIERLQLGHASPLYDAEEVQASIGNGPRPVGETDQRKYRTRSPDFGIRRARGLQRGEGKNNVTDRAGANQQLSLNG